MNPEKQKLKDEIFAEFDEKGWTKMIRYDEGGNDDVMIDMETAKEFLSSALDRYATAKVEEQEKELIEYINHDQNCILSRYEQGRPTKNGYENKIAGKWYETRPIDKTPSCRFPSSQNTSERTLLLQWGNELPFSG